MTTTKLAEIPTDSSENYGYRRYPAIIAGAYGAVHVWPTAEHTSSNSRIVWSPDHLVLVDTPYQNEAWHARRLEQRSRPRLNEGDTIVLGDTEATVPHVRPHTTGVPFPESGELCRLCKAPLDEDNDTDPETGSWYGAHAPCVAPDPDGRYVVRVNNTDPEYGRYRLEGRAVEVARDLSRSNYRSNRFSVEQDLDGRRTQLRCFHGTLPEAG